MIHAFTKINALDLKSGYNFDGMVVKLLSQYMEYVDFFDDGSLLLDCDKVGLYLAIQDWTGWTKLNSIACVSKITTWYRLIIDQDNALRPLHATKEELIPVYDPSQSIRGFHGETKFLYQLKGIGDLVHGDKIRHRDLTGPEDDHPQQFGTVLAAEPDPLESDSSRFETVGYEIETLSGFYNGNGVHLAANNITEKIKDASYK